MNPVDKAIAFFSPEAAVRRQVARARLEAFKRFYDGATIGHRGESIRRSNADPNVVSRKTLPKLRAGSHDLVRNNPNARDAKRVITNNTIGAGVIPQFRKNDKRYKKLDDLAAEYLDSRDCDADGLHDYYGLQGLIMDTVFESGECLIRRRWRRPSDGLPVPMQYQVLEPDFLDILKDGDLSNGGRIIQGVEFDPIGRRVAYWLHSEHPGSSSLSFRAVASKRIPARDVIHVFEVERPGQVRGIPWLAPVMLRLADYADYEDAQLVRQKIAACFAAFYYGDESADLPTGDDVDSDTPKERIEPGIIERLPAGVDLKFAVPPGVEGYKDYASVSMHQIAAGLGISYEALTGDLSGVNFSSARMGWLQFQRNITSWQNRMLIPRCFNPMMQWFADAAQMTGVSIDGTKVKHTPPRREMIDPTKEVPAQRDAIRSGQKTISQVIQEAGRDPEEFLRELADDFTMLDELGLVLDIDPRKVTANGLSQALPDGSYPDTSN